MSKYARRVDRNHSEIRDGLRAEGWDVMDLSGAGDGIPDLCINLQPGGKIGRPHFIECKDGKKPPSARKLTEAQEQWRKYCGHVTTTVTSLEEAKQALAAALSHAEL